MNCPECKNEDNEICIETNDKFEIVESKTSNSNWDDWDFWAKIKCKSCGHIFTFEQ